MMQTHTKLDMLLAHTGITKPFRKALAASHRRLRDANVRRVESSAHG
jgi:hypothetical protein